MARMYGVDVALTRADDLDKRVLTYIAECMAIGITPHILDLGCGAGGQSVRMVAAGAQVTGVDVVDHTAAFTALLRTDGGYTEDQLRFVSADMCAISTSLPEVTFDAVVLQRAIHYLPYREARTLLTTLRTMTDRLYVSVTGLESAIGAAYSIREKALEERFGQLEPTAQTTFSIAEPVCLYTPEEFLALLVTSGWQVEECWVSAFGNIKVICRN